MDLKQLLIEIHFNNPGFLVTTKIDDWIYAEWDTVEDALINFLDVLKIVREKKDIFISCETTKKALFQLPISW